MNALGVAGEAFAVVSPTGGLLLRAHLNTARVAGMILLDVPAVRAQLTPLHVASALLERPVPAGSSIEAYAAGALFGSTISTLKSMGVATHTVMPDRWRNALNIRGDVVAAANKLFASHDFALADDAIAALLALYGSRLSLHGLIRSAGVSQPAHGRTFQAAATAALRFLFAHPPARCWRRGSFLRR